MPALKRKSWTLKDLAERDLADFKKSRVGFTTRDVEPSSSPVVNKSVHGNETGAKEVEIKIPVDNNKEVQRLNKELEEMKERVARLEEESNHKSAQLSRIREMVQCAICKETIRNPYTLECGHSSCYKCLRRWWLTSSSSQTTHNDVPAEIITAEDSNAFNDEDDRPASLPQAGPSRTTSSSDPHSHRYQLRFRPITHLQKQCPECRKAISPWNRPAPDYRLRDVVDALRLRPLSSAQQMRRDMRWGQRHDVWRGIFPSSNGTETDGLAMSLMSLLSSRQTHQTQHAFYVPPWHTQGQIETPPDLSSSFPFHLRRQVAEHRAERRLQPYRTADPQRRERRRFERYDPVREAHSEIEERERQDRARARIPSPTPLEGSYPPPLEFSPVSQILRTASSLAPEAAPALALLNRPPQPQPLEPAEAVQTQIHLPALQQQTFSQPRLQLPSIRDILSHSWPSSTAIPEPFLATSQFRQIMRLQNRPRTPPIDVPLRFNIDGGFLLENEDDAEEVSSEISYDDGDDGDTDESDVSEPDASAGAWIGADLED